jgi:methionyl-tRNA formyltransferase
MGGRYVVVASRGWNRRVFDDVIADLPGSWSFIADRDGLTVDALEQVDPEYVFFLHWSWKVPDEIVNRFECIVFHMTDVPFGRGGTPLQNLIAGGHSHTKLSAIRMTSEIDAGPVYAKEALCLAGPAEEVYIRASHVAAGMIERIIAERLLPAPQEGEVVDFARRGPADSELPSDLPGLDALHDFIRMLDADGYPRAFTTSNGFRFELSRSARYDGRVEADVRITLAEDAP